MIEQVRLAYRFLIVMGLGLLLLILAVFLPVMSSNADFSIYNTGYYGCSSLGVKVYRTGTFMPTIDVSGSTKDMVVHTSLPELEPKLDPPKSSLLIIGPERSFDDKEWGFVHRFMMMGGKVLIADDFGSGRDLLSKLNTTTTISGRKLVSLSFEKSGNFSVATDMVVHPVTEGVSMVLLNHPSAVIPSPLATALLSSNPASWLDEDQDMVQGSNEMSRPFPLLTIEPYGKGELMVLSDPSIMINGMQGHLNNSRLVSNIVGYLTEDRDQLVVDETHRDITNPVHVMNVYVANIPGWLKVVMISCTLSVFVLAGSSMPARFRDRMERLLKKLLGEEAPRSKTVDEVFDEIMKRHPDWDRKALARLRASVGGQV